MNGVAGVWFTYWDPPAASPGKQFSLGAAPGEVGPLRVSEASSVGEAQ